MAKISVVIPMYNVEDYLRECLDNIIGQTLKDIEIICVDDGSPDNSAQIVTEYIEKHKDKNIKLIRKPNGGLSSARNAALDVAKGEYVYFIDSDDYIDTDTLEQLYQRASEDELEILFFNAVSFFESEEIKAKNPQYISLYNRTRQYPGVHIGQQLFMKMRQNGEFFGSACLLMFKRSLLEDNHLRFYEGIIHEDNLFTFQAVILAKRAGYIDKAFYHRRVRSDSIMTVKKSMRNVEGYLVSYEEMLAFLSDKEIDEEVSRVINSYLYDSIYGNAYRIYCGLDINDGTAKLTKGSYVAEYFLDTIKRQKKLDKTNQNLKKKANSLDYRVGNKILLVPRKIKGCIRLLKKNGLKKTIKEFLKFGRNFRKLAFKLKRKFSSKPFVSIIMPVYNVEKYLEEALKTLLSQTLKQIEIICVDDGSTDGSLEILNAYAKKDSRIKVYTQENKFAGVARNLGLEKAQGEYVVFLDSDDFFVQKLAEEAYYAAKINKADVVLWGAKHYHNVTHEYKKAGWLLNSKVAPKKQPFSYKDCPDKLYQITTPCPWTKMFRRKFVLETGLQFQALRNSNDVFFTYASLAMAKKIAIANKDLVYYRVGMENNLQATKKKDPFCFLEAYKAWHDKLVEIGKFEELRQSYTNSALSGCLHNLRSTKELEAKKVVFDKLKNEAFEMLEITMEDKEYYYKEQDFEDLMTIRNCTFEEYVEKNQIGK